MLIWLKRQRFLITRTETVTNILSDSVYGMGYETSPFDFCVVQLQKIRHEGLLKGYLVHTPALRLYLKLRVFVRPLTHFRRIIQCVIKFQRRQCMAFWNETKSKRENLIFHSFSLLQVFRSAKLFFLGSGILFERLFPSSNFLKSTILAKTNVFNSLGREWWQIFWNKKEALA